MIDQSNVMETTNVLINNYSKINVFISHKRLN